MKSNIPWLLRKIIYLLIIIIAITTMIVVYRGIENPITNKFIAAIGIFTLLGLFYIIFITFFNLSKLKISENKIRIINCVLIGILILLGIFLLN